MTFKIVLIDLFLVAKIMFILENWENNRKAQRKLQSHLLQSEPLLVYISFQVCVFFPMQIHILKIKWDHADLYLHKCHLKSKLEQL